MPYAKPETSFRVQKDNKRPLKKLTLGMNRNVKEDYGDIHHTDISGTVDLQLWIDDTSFLPWKHGCGSNSVYA